MSCEHQCQTFPAAFRQLRSTMSLQFAPPSASRVGERHRRVRACYFRTGVTDVLAMFLAERCRREGHVKGKRGRPALVDTGTSTVTYRPRTGATRAEKPANRRVGMLPMRNGSRHGEAPQDDGANPCISNICHTAPGDERPPFAETFCGILYRANCISLYVSHIKPVSPPLCFLQRLPCRLCYDGGAHAS
jgi:hypothetical protein